VVKARFSIKDTCTNSNVSKNKHIFQSDL
jgi:hypothetical protein